MMKLEVKAPGNTGEMQEVRPDGQYAADRWLPNALHGLAWQAEAGTGLRLPANGRPIMEGTQTALTCLGVAGATLFVSKRKVGEAGGSAPTC